jgi:hypothetical protein
MVTSARADGERFKPFPVGLESRSVLDRVNQLGDRTGRSRGSVDKFHDAACGATARAAVVRRHDCLLEARWQCRRASLTEAVTYGPGSRCHLGFSRASPRSSTAHDGGLSAGSAQSAYLHVQGFRTARCSRCDPDRAGVSRPRPAFRTRQEHPRAMIMIEVMKRSGA